MLKLDLWKLLLDLKSIASDILRYIFEPAEWIRYIAIYFNLPSEYDTWPANKPPIYLQKSFILLTHPPYLNLLSSIWQSSLSHLKVMRPLSLGVFLIKASPLSLILTYSQDQDHAHTMMTVGSSAIPSYVWGIDKEGAYLYSGETISAIIASVIITFSKKNLFSFFEPFLCHWLVIPVGQSSGQIFAQRRVEHKTESRYERTCCHQHYHHDSLDHSCLAIAFN